MIFRAVLCDISQTITRATFNVEIPSAAKIRTQHQIVRTSQMEVNAPSNAGECSNFLKLRCFEEQNEFSTETVGVNQRLSTCLLCWLHIYKPSRSVTTQTNRDFKQSCFAYLVQIWWSEIERMMSYRTRTVNLVFDTHTQTSTHMRM